MILIEDANIVFVRIDRGEDVISAMNDALEQVSATALLIASGVGAFSHIVFGVYDIARDTFDPEPREGFLEIVSLAGNIVRRDGKPWTHLHAVCSQPDLSLMGGHVLSARCGLTVELTMLKTDAALERVRLPGQPATYILCNGR